MGAMRCLAASRLAVAVAVAARASDRGGALDTCFVAAHVGAGVAGDSYGKLYRVGQDERL